MANMNIEEEVFQLPVDITADGKVTKTLKTKDTYVDKDIKVEITTPDGELEVKNAGGVSATASVVDNAFTSDTETEFAITVHADAHADEVKVGVKTPGFVIDDVVTVAEADAEQNAKTVYIKEGELSGEGDVAVTGNVKLEEAEAAGDDGFYITASADGAVTVSTAGWLKAGTSADTDSSAVYKIETLTFAAAGKDDDVSGYTEEKITVPSEGYLLLKEGYITNTKISLADLIPDEATVTVDAAKYILTGYSAYDKDGKLVTGTMDTLTNAAISNKEAQASAEVSSITITAADDKSKFNVTGEKAITGLVTVDVAGAGYVTEDGLTKTFVNPYSEASKAVVNTTLDVAKVAATIDGAEKVTPVIVKETGTAKSGDIATSAPEGKHYVAVNTEALSQTITAQAAVTVEGYATPDVYTAAAPAIGTVGANAAGSYYIGIDNGEVSAEGSIDGADVTLTVDFAVNGSAADISTAGILASAPSEGKYITVGASTDSKTTDVTGSVVTTVSEGYVENDSITTNVSKTITVNAAENAKYIKVYEGLYL